MDAKYFTLIMERIEPEVASMKSVRDDGSETSILLNPSAIFYKKKLSIFFLRKSSMLLLQSVPQQPRDLSCPKSLPCRHLWRADP